MGGERGVVESLFLAARPSHPTVRVLSLVCYVAALAAVFVGLRQLDSPLQNFARGLHVLWVERLGDWLGLLGEGWGLIAVSTVMLAIGYGLHHATLRQSGIDGLIAHGAAGLVAQILKHSIGRPRPRFMRDQEFFTGPSFQSGFDSFPSGHASASFAVATVLAKHFPRWGWCAYGIAGMIAVSRIVRGSHFVTDAMGGIVVGVLMGTLIVHPLREWRTSLAAALMKVTPFVAVAFVLTWTVCQSEADEEQQAMMLWMGSVAMAFGVGSRWSSAVTGRASAFQPYIWPAIGTGLAATTGSWLIVLITALLLLATWPDREAGPETLPGETGETGHQAILLEAGLTALLVFFVWCLQGLKGVLLQQ